MSKLTEQQLVFLGYLDEFDGDFEKAMDSAGYSRNSRAWLKRALKESMAEMALENMAAAAVEATFKMQKVMKDPNQPGAPTVIKAASEILNRAGIQSSEENTLKVPTTGLFILPAKGSRNKEVEDEVEES